MSSNFTNVTEQVLDETNRNVRGQSSDTSYRMDNERAQNSISTPTISCTKLRNFGEREGTRSASTSPRNMQTEPQPSYNTDGTGYLDSSYRNKDSVSNSTNRNKTKGQEDDTNKKETKPRSGSLDRLLKLPRNNNTTLSNNVRKIPVVRRLSNTNCQLKIIEDCLNIYDSIGVIRAKLCTELYSLANKIQEEYIVLELIFSDKPIIKVLRVSDEETPYTYPLSSINVNGINCSFIRESSISIKITCILKCTKNELQCFVPKRNDVQKPNLIFVCWIIARSSCVDESKDLYRSLLDRFTLLLDSFDISTVLYCIDMLEKYHLLEITDQFPKLIKSIENTDNGAIDTRIKYVFSILETSAVAVYGRKSRILCFPTDPTDLFYYVFNYYMLEPLIAYKKISYDLYIRVTSINSTQLNIYSLCQDIIRIDIEDIISPLIISSNEDQIKLEAHRKRINIVKTNMMDSGHGLSYFHDYVPLHNAMTHIYLGPQKDENSDNNDILTGNSSPIVSIASDSASIPPNR